MLRYRDAVAVRSGLGWIRRCCEEGRPMQLDKSLFYLGAIKALDRPTLLHWQGVAIAHGHLDCVEVLQQKQTLNGKESNPI